MHASEQIVLVVSETVLTETYRALGAKAPRTVPELTRLLTSIPPEVVANPTDDDVITLAPTVNRKDALIVASAIRGGVDWFVTGDRTLRAELNQSGLTLVVLNPSELVEILNDD